MARPWAHMMEAHGNAHECVCASGARLPRPAILFKADDRQSIPVRDDPRNKHGGKFTQSREYGRVERVRLYRLDCSHVRQYSVHRPARAITCVTLSCELLVPRARARRHCTAHAAPGPHSIRHRLTTPRPSSPPAPQIQIESKVKSAVRVTRNAER